jgi:hypothetical protein
MTSGDSTFNLLRQSLKLSMNLAGDAIRIAKRSTTALAILDAVPKSNVGSDDVWADELVCEAEARHSLSEEPVETKQERMSAWARTVESMHENILAL